MGKLKAFLSGKGLWEPLCYLFVGGCATLVEWAVFWLLSEKLTVHYQVGTAIAFCVSTLANWALGRLLVFRRPEGTGLARELLSIYAAAAVGLGLNLLIMFVLVDRFGLSKMLSKIAATALVFAYNYLIRRYVIYREK